MIINATSVGLKKEDVINLNFSSSVKGKFFYDVIYNPQETNFLKVGKKTKNTTLNGKMMFVFQAHAAFNIWHALEPDINEKVLKLLD
jgi:shikimate dehydrogenase